MHDPSVHDGEADRDSLNRPCGVPRAENPDIDKKEE